MDSIVPSSVSASQHGDLCKRGIPVNVRSLSVSTVLSISVRENTATVERSGTTITPHSAGEVGYIIMDNNSFTILTNV